MQEQTYHKYLLYWLWSKGGMTKVDIPKIYLYALFTPLVVVFSQLS